MAATTTSKHELSAAMIDAVCQRIASNQRVRRTLPQKGRLHIDRQLPFLCVYRRPAGAADAGTQRLVQGEAAYLIAPGARRHHDSVASLVRQIVATQSARFGAFLIVEIWAASSGRKADDPAVPTVLPAFTVHAPATSAMTRTVEVLERGLSKVKVLKQGVVVEVLRGGRGRPPAARPLLTAAEARALSCSVIGIAVPPVYRRPDSPEEFPLLARRLRRSLSLALRRAYFEFARAHTTHRPSHYHALGRRAVVKAVWEIDRRLSAVSSQFDYLLLLTPVNTRRAFRVLQRARFERVPEFHYRPSPVDPALLKRELYKIPIERVEDPALQRLFQEQQEELELKLNLLRDRDTARFLHVSMQLFGGVQDDLLQLALELLSQLPGSARRDEGLEGRQRRKVTAEDFARLAEAEFDHYRRACPAFQATAEIVDDVSGLYVSRGRLLITSDLSLPPARVDALLAHEVGTHLLTYFNGRQQPFRQLYSGLAGYEELQEGLAVLSEHLVGGLSRARMRQLAARVVAVHHLTGGASFVETFRALHVDHGLGQRAAYNVAMRVYRGGGLTKDAVYLRGLAGIVRYVQAGGELGPLLVGKVAVEHVPIIKELQYRKVLTAAPIVPRHLADPAALARLEQLRGAGGSLVDLVCGAAARPGRSSP